MVAKLETISSAPAGRAPELEIGPAFSSQIHLLKLLTGELLGEIDKLQASCEEMDYPGSLNQLRSLETETPEAGFDLRTRVRDYEIALIAKALRQSGGSQIRAAQLLGIKPTTLNDKIKRYRISIGFSSSLEFRKNFRAFG